MNTLKCMIATLCIISMTACSHKLEDDSIFSTYKNEPRAEVVVVPKLMMKLGTGMAKMGIGDKDDRRALNLVSKIHSIRILDLDDCSWAVKQRFLSDVQHLGESGYETLMRMNSDGEDVKLLLQRDGTDITELLIVNTSDDDAELIQLKGRIKESEIDRIMESEFVDD